MKGTNWSGGERTSALRSAGCSDLASCLAGTEGTWLQGPPVPSPQLLEGRKGFRGGEPRSKPWESIDSLVQRVGPVQGYTAPAGWGERLAV